MPTCASFFCQQYEPSDWNRTILLLTEGQQFIILLDAHLHSAFDPVDQSPPDERLNPPHQLRSVIYLGLRVVNNANRFSSIVNLDVHEYKQVGRK